ncbi:TPA: hypothetical protein OSY43_002052 [Escherichia coli]|uniref:hypothetical protein n=1 Tax=Enterobacteriaceae TaxID=543 RepID=UPI0017A65984|nr:MULTISPECIES: hypothetical protein [Enterobacteriaceae]EFE4491887.1 hypothetical protein [Escherichia coli]EFO1619032.1 hypothetical protein [Escherichia coli]EHC5019413.1 hypothetical protein [Escherichia coli]EKD4460449.1 hypothetical protein [Escherichia coli]MBK2821633.1 hypothetical protein [Enterobacter hormaechei]
MTTKSLIQLIDIPDFRFTKQEPDINYGDIASDCDCKTISILHAIQHISETIFNMSECENVENEKIRELSGVISDLAELTIATNKISQTASYLCGVKDGINGA